MIEFTTKDSLIYKRKEVWFYSSEDIKLSDNTLFYQAQKIHSDAQPEAVHKMSTLEINLSLSEDKIFSEMKSRLRSYINQAEKLEFQCGFSDVYSDQLFNEFFKNQLAHAKEKKLLPPNRERFLSYMSSNNFLLSSIKYKNQSLVQHFYIHDSERIRMVTSHHCTGLNKESEEQVALANKFLHWQDILEAKKRSLKIYDFGGISTDPDNGIARFKKSYGGEVKNYFNYVVTKGLFAFAHSTKNQLKQLTQGSVGEKLT